MSIPKKLINYLEGNKIKFELIKHRVVYTAWNLFQTLHLKNPAEVVKTLVLRVDKEAVIVLLPADKNLDKAKFKKTLNQWRKKQGLKSVKEVDFVNEIWLKKNVKLGKLGMTPPFGRLLKMTVFVDNSILKQAKIIVNSGDYEVSLKIKTKDFIELEQPIRGVFGKKK